VSMAAFGIEYEEITEGVPAEATGTDTVRRNDEHFWQGAATNRHKEIDV